MDKATFLRLVNTGWRLRLFLLWKLPAAWFLGIRVRYCDENKAVTVLPYGWRSQNPFQSSYFAAQCAAGELSTGLLALAALQGQPPVSMLVMELRAGFQKKAAATLLFECVQGKEVTEAIQKALEEGTPQTITMVSEGRLPDGTLASVVEVTWSFRRKN